MGISHPVHNFDGRVIAVVKRNDGSGRFLVVAPKKSRYIKRDITGAIAFAEKENEYSIDCLYEYSCGAVVYRIINGEYRFLLIKNKRSAHWGFPKGHVENDETPEETARREVLEETGLNIELISDFESRSEYTIQGKVEKSVTIFLAKTADTRTIIQREEIEDYVWLNYDKAITTLKFENDRSILSSAYDFMVEKGIISK
ncbi:MAG: NUDIX domain-containing protein [Clostridiales bacterium]|nr:NUDIX domain-containing protein [Clostridiales bacterium]